MKDREFRVATAVNLDDSTKPNFYLVCLSDCYDPPMAAIRADNESDAEEEFVDQLPWSHIPEDMHEEMQDSDEVGYGPSGQMYDSVSVRVMLAKVVGIIV